MPSSLWESRILKTAGGVARPGANAHASDLVPILIELKVRPQSTYTLMLAFTAYALVVLWYWRHGRPDEDVARVKQLAPWYRHKQAPSFADMLAALRRELWLSRFLRNLFSSGYAKNSMMCCPIGCLRHKNRETPV